MQNCVLIHNLIINNIRTDSMLKMEYSTMKEELPNEKPIKN